MYNNIGELFEYMKTLNGTESLGIELGSTRIKAVLVDNKCNILAQGSHVWENKFENGVWTYSMQQVKDGLQDAYAQLNKDCESKFGQKITTLGSLGISAMMHGYLPFDNENNLLVPFRTWRNTITAEAAQKLTDAFGFNIPQRWSIAHLYQAVLSNEEHIAKIDSINTLAGYVHYLLSGEKVVGIGEASGMFPIDSVNLCYNREMLDKFDSLAGGKLNKKLEDILPRVAVAGDNAGCLTKDGAALLDPEGNLNSGALMCPPEGDAGTGMVATNAIAPRTGNVSAGTSIFSMVVLEKPMNEVHEEIDIVTTPVGKDVAMVHCNNCCTDIDAWVNFVDDSLKTLGIEKDKGELYSSFYSSALEGDKDCGGLTVINYYSGEPVAHVEDGQPVFIREKSSTFTLKNIARAQLNSAMCTLKIGMEILDKTGVEIDYLNGHGGLFKTSVSGAKLMAAAMNCKINCMKTAGEGGAWGMAILAAYALSKEKTSLEAYLADVVFANAEMTSQTADSDDAEGFEVYYNRFKKAIKKHC